MKLHVLLKQAVDANTDTLSPFDKRDIQRFGLRNVVLSDYQLYGASWLQNCFSQRRGGLLCDEMGLGKTLQTITFVSAVLHQDPNSRILLVVPLSVFGNWSTELRIFSPSIRFVSYIGNQSERESLQTVFQNSKSPLLLTSYEICMNDQDFLKNFQWDILVVDEGHRLKNSESILYKVLLEICKQTKFILTGTPVQNNLAELFNLLHFVAPHHFPSKLRDDFVSYFDSTQLINDHHRSDELSKVIRPFLLRRTKQQVSLNLPPRLDFLLYHHLTPLQINIYRALLTRNADLVSLVSGSQSRSLRLVNLLVQLRKCVDHPYLFDGVEPEPFELGPHLIEASGKLVLLDRLLDFLWNPFNGDSMSAPSAPVHKVLVFSQMTRMLDIIQDYLTLKDYPCVRLDGSVRGEDRLSAVKEFNDTSGCFVFLLSTKAGGQGLNLTAADTVILVDSDFNPQNDIQAAARVHRIGQTKPVRIIRLVGRDTIEEGILSRADAKLKLATQVLGSSTDQSSVDGQQDLETVLKFGLVKLFQGFTVNENATCENGHFTKQVDDLNFADILGVTDPHTGHWLPPRLSESSKPDGWVFLTDEPYQCEVSDVDWAAVAKMKQEYESQMNNQASEASDGGVCTRAKLQTAGSTAICDKALQSSLKPMTPEELAEHTKKVSELREAKLQRAKELAEKRAAKKLEKKMCLWASVNYRSLVVYKTEAVQQLQQSTCQNPTFWPLTEPDSDDSILHPAGIYYTVGDASQPLARFDASTESSQLDYPRPAVVCLSIDTSGYWPRGGFFGALNKKTSLVCERYQLASEMDDLHLGDCHLIPVPQEFSTRSSDVSVEPFPEIIASNPGNDFAQTNFCGLLVAQRHTRRSQSAGAPPELHLDALEQSLCALSIACQRLNQCSVHVPRLGHGTHAFQWYTVERLLRKYLVERARVPVFVYYYRRPSEENVLESTATAPDDDLAQSPTTDVSSPKRARVALPSTRHLEDIFSGKCFYLDSPSDSEDKENNELIAIRRLIIAYDGDIASDFCPGVTHVVKFGSGENKLCVKSVPIQDCFVVTPSWIRDSVRDRSCPPESNYSV